MLMGVSTINLLERTHFESRNAVLSTDPFPFILHAFNFSPDSFNFRGPPERSLNSSQEKRKILLFQYKRIHAGVLPKIIEILEDVPFPLSTASLPQLAAIRVKVNKIVSR